VTRPTLDQLNSGRDARARPLPTELTAREGNYGTGISQDWARRTLRVHSTTKHVTLQKMSQSNFSKKFQILCPAESALRG
jgi:hypothetical protein